MKKFIALLIISLIVFTSVISCSKPFNYGCGAFSSGKVIISEVKKSNFLKLKNEKDVSVNLENWKLMEVRQDLFGGKDTSIYIIPAGMLVNPCAKVDFSASTLGFSLSADETVYLYNSQGELISQMFWMFFIN